MPNLRKFIKNPYRGRKTTLISNCTLKVDAIVSADILLHFGINTEAFGNITDLYTIGWGTVYNLKCEDAPYFLEDLYEIGLRLLRKTYYINDDFPLSGKYEIEGFQILLQYDNRFQVIYSLAGLSSHKQYLFDIQNVNNFTSMVICHAFYF